eukprot:4772999-Amphidinium_carterae.1
MQASLASASACAKISFKVRRLHLDAWNMSCKQQHMENVHVQNSQWRLQLRMLLAGFGSSCCCTPLFAPQFPEATRDVVVNSSDVTLQGHCLYALHSLLAMSEVPDLLSLPVLQRACCARAAG